MKRPENPLNAVGKVSVSLLERDGKRRKQLKQIAKAAGQRPKLRNDLLPRLELVQREPGSLLAPKRNVRASNEAHTQAVANAISALGFTVPVLIDGDNVVLDGVTRIEAAKLLGLTSIPCIVAESLSPSERKLLRMAINRLSEKGSWNLDELKVELKELVVDDAPIEISVCFGLQQ